ncbi:MAG: putative universal stress protein [Blastococcus sp.]|nr:putative universal stress protein [Blastococcus sp.]
MTIVVGYVPTPQGDAALTAAIQEAQLRKEGLHVVNTSRGSAPVDNRLANAEQLTAVRQRLDESGVDYQIDQKFKGDEPSAQLVDLADELEASLIVIGLRRRSATGKLITGSQAQRILLDANCPVLAVKAD